MNAIPNTVDLDNYRQRVSNLIVNNGEALIFIDTNILVWMYRLNGESFEELHAFFLRLCTDRKLIVPNWVVHEYNNLLSSYSDDIFFPFKKGLKAILNQMNQISEVARLVADNEFSRKHGYADKKEFVQQSSSEISSLSKKINLLIDKNNFSVSDRRAKIENLISTSQSAVPLTSLQSFDLKYQFRLDHRIPPGFEDAHKETNRFGDIILWHEIIENCERSETQNAVFISLDVKKDWVYSPLNLTIDNSIRPVGQSEKHYFLVPWLQQEFHERAKGEVFFCNLKSLIDILYSPDYNAIDFERFKSLAKTVDIELRNNETNKIIEWLISNPEQLSHLINTTCRWERSPDEVDITKLENWCRTNIRERIEFNSVNWSNVFVQLFI